MLRSSLRLTRGARALSTAALPEVAPMTMFGTAGRYTNALYAAAAKKGALLEVQADLTLLKETLSSSPLLAAFVADPSQSREAKTKGIVDILTSAKASETTKNALATMAEGGRLEMLPKLIDMYDELIVAAKGDLTAIVTSAEPIPASQLKDIEKYLINILGGDASKIKLTTKVDPGLIDGMTIEVGDKYLDYSTATQLKKLHQLLNDGL